MADEHDFRQLLELAEGQGLLRAPAGYWTAREAQQRKIAAEAYEDLRKRAGRGDRGAAAFLTMNAAQLPGQHRTRRRRPQIHGLVEAAEKVAKASARPAARTKGGRFKVLQICRQMATACGIANFASNVHAALLAAGVEVETQRSLPAVLNADVVLIHHEFSFYSGEAFVRLLDQAGGLPRIVAAHSPGLEGLDERVEAFVTMAPDMLQTGHAVHQAFLPAFTRPLRDRAELRAELDLPADQFLIGSGGFVTPPRQFARWIYQLGPICRKRGWGLVLQTPRHHRQTPQLDEENHQVSLAAEQFADVVHLQRRWLTPTEANSYAQAADLLWVWTQVASQSYGSAAASDLWGSGTQILAADKIQHGAILGRPGTVTGPEAFGPFLDALVALAATGESPRHDPAGLSWEAWTGPFLAFLRKVAL